MKTPQFIRTTLLLAGLSIALCGTSARAQYEDGSLIGSIHDATGAAVPNAAITVTNIDTGNVIHVSATSSGDYEIPSLRVGLYNIEATAPSFAPEPSLLMDSPTASFRHRSYSSWRYRRTPDPTSCRASPRR